MEHKAQIEFRSGLFLSPESKEARQITTTKHREKSEKTGKERKGKEILDKKMGLETSP